MQPLSTRLLYGAGGTVYAVKEAAYNMFVLLFYTQVLGLNGSVTGGVIAISLLWDAVSDPLVGALSDQLRSSKGRRHPLMNLSIFPMGLGFLGLFWPPAFLVDSPESMQFGLGAWLLFWSLWVRTFVTLYAIPSVALSTDISDDYQERSAILGTRLAFIFLFSVLVPATALLFIFANGEGDGRFIRENYVFYGIFSCIVCWVMGTTSSIGTRRYAVSTDAASGGVSAEVRTVRRTLRHLIFDVARTWENKSFRSILGCEIATMSAYGIVSALNMIVWTYYWRFDAQTISLILALPSLVAVALVMLLLKTLGERFEKHQLLQISLSGLILNCLWLYPAHMLGLLPSDQPRLLLALNLVLMLAFMCFFLMRSIQAQSIIADISDEHDWEHGRRQEGAFFAASNFAQKIATVMGPLYGGVVIDVIGLDSSAPPGSVPQGVLDHLIYAYGLGVLPGLLVALFFALRIDIDRLRVKELQALLRARNRREDAKLP